MPSQTVYLTSVLAPPWDNLHGIAKSNHDCQPLLESWPVIECRHASGSQPLCTSHPTWCMLAISSIGCVYHGTMHCLFVQELSAVQAMLSPHSKGHTFGGVCRTHCQYLTALIVLRFNEPHSCKRHTWYLLETDGCSMSGQTLRQYSCCLPQAVAVSANPTIIGCAATHFQLSHKIGIYAQCSPTLSHTGSSDRSVALLTCCFRAA